MSNEDGSVWVVYNGEIYNFKELRSELLRVGHAFHSDSDSEVLIHGYEEWGIERLLKKLQGMFAFGLYDIHRGLMLARDRMGIKPLYYYADSGVVLFASEVRALVRSGLVSCQQDRKALAGFLLAGSVPSPRTIVKGVSCLPPGNWAESRNGELSLHNYWDLAGSPAESGPEAALEECLQDTVRRHLVSDVPLGVFLSGGVDSAGLVALASRIRTDSGVRLHTLTVVFDEPDYTESAAAGRIAGHFGTEHQEICVTFKDFRRELPLFLQSMDQPTNDGVNSYFVSQAARKAGLTVVLSGLGGDEVFWGYSHYRWLQRARYFESCPAPIRRSLALFGSGWGRLAGRDNWMRMSYVGRSGSANGLYLMLRGFFAPERAARLLDMSRIELDGIVEEQFGLGVGTTELTRDRVFNYVEMKKYLHDQLLRDTDVFSMAHSIEARVPYLDHILVERLWRMESHLKLDRSINKPILVRGVDDPLLFEVAARKKRGFTFPMSRWMKACLPDLREMAGTASLDRGAMRGCWDDFARGHLHWSRAWVLAVLGAQS
jgi:asparagine synthase (glutamine-hydrolysing)